MEKKYDSRSDLKFFALLRSGAVSGAYLFYGKEPYGKERALKQLKNLLNPAVSEMNYLRLKAPSAREVIAAAEALPFFDERRLVIVSGLPADQQETLINFLPHLPQSTLLIFVEEGTLRCQTLKELLSKQGRAVDFAPYDETMAVTFLLKRAQENNIAMDKFTARSLVTMVGNDLYALESSLLKVGAYAGFGKPVGESHLKACIIPNLEYKIFTLTDFLIAGNKKGAMAQLSAMLKDGESPMGLSAFLVGQFRKILAAKECLAAGMKEEAIVKKLGGKSEFANKKTIAHAKKLPLPAIRQALTDFGQVDLLQKQGKMKDGDALHLAMLKTLTNLSAPRSPITANRGRRA